MLSKPYEVRKAPTSVRSRSGGGSFIGADTELYCKNLIACAFSFSSFICCSSDLTSGFNTGFSASGGNNLSIIFFFFFFLVSGTETLRPTSFSGLISEGGFLTLFFSLAMVVIGSIGGKTIYPEFDPQKVNEREWPALVVLYVLA